MLRRLLLVLIDKELRNKLLMVLGLLVCARILTHVPIPVLTNTDISDLINNDAIYNLLNVVSGGGYGNLSFVMLGLGPYITATIVFQLLGVIVPKINEIQKEEGEIGRNKINRWTRFAVIPLAAINGWGVLQFLSSQNSGGQGAKVQLPAVLTTSDLSVSFPHWSLVIMSLVAGSIIMMWIGEIITELKMGNGISLMILAGIVIKLPTQMIKFVKDVLPNVGDIWNKIARDPSVLTRLDNYRDLFWDGPAWNPTRVLILYFVIFFFTLAFVIYVNDAVRKLAVVYSRRGASEGRSRLLDNIKATLPIKVNMAGVLPIIFAVYFILFPSIMSRFFFTANIPQIKDTAQVVEQYLSTQRKPNFFNEKAAEIPKNNFLGLYATSTPSQIEAAKLQDTTQGQELFGFTISTQKDVENSYFEGTPINFKFKGNNLGFMPEFSLRHNGVLAYSFYYFILIIFFTYFYTSTIAFKTEEVAQNLQESGAYIPGFRPGKETADYLGYVSNRLNVAGSLFLALIASVPLLFSESLQLGDGTLTAIVGGTTLLILVSVTTETLKQIEAQASIVDYDRFAK